MRFCILYDCLFPWTIGGAERWYRNLALELAKAGHEVTYLTLRQWDEVDSPDLPGVRVVAVGPRLALYRDGKRRVWPPMRFGMGVLWHLMLHGRRYDRVHTASFPFFSLLAAAVVRPFARFSIAVDWHEVWSLDYWRSYLGRAGVIGWWVQALCARVPQMAYSFSELHRARVSAIGLRGEATLLPGEYSGTATAGAAEAASPPTVVYAGRFIAEKRLDLLVDALALVLRDAPTLRAILIGQGPDHEAIRKRIAAHGIEDAVTLPGFVDEAVVERSMADATAIVQPSAREGYGMVVVEAAARGVPAVVVAAPDNAAVELVTPGENGFIADPDPAALAAKILACHEGGAELRARTRAWYAANYYRLSIGHSVELVLAGLAPVAPILR